jgi:hypothetical protein
MNILNFLKQNWIPIILSIIVTCVIIYIKKFNFNKINELEDSNSKLKETINDLTGALENSSKTLRTTINTLENKLTYGTIAKDPKPNVVSTTTTTILDLESNKMTSDSKSNKEISTVNKIPVVNDEIVLDEKKTNSPLLTRGELIIEVKDNSSLIENNTQPFSIFSLIDCEIENALYDLGITASHYNETSENDLQSVYDDRITELNEDDLEEKHDIQTQNMQIPNTFKELIANRNLNLIQAN